MLYVPLPCVLDLKTVAYPNISDNGTNADITCAPPLGFMPSILPLLELTSPITSPMYSSDTTISTFITGSSNTGVALAIPLLNAIEPATLNAISDESTAWYDPS